MAEQTDAVAQELPDEGWELAGAFRVARSPAGWSVVGGWEEADAVGVHVVIHHPTSDEMIRRVRVRFPVTVEDGVLTLGEPEVTPA